MSSSPLPQWHSSTKSSHGRTSCRHGCFFLTFNNISRMGIAFSSVLVGLIFYMAVLSPHGPLLLSSPESYGLFKLDANSIQQSSNQSTPTNHASSSSTSNEAPSSPLNMDDDLSLEQIRDIVAPTRGFFARDYGLHLGWNNVSTHGNPIRAELMISK